MKKLLSFSLPLLVFVVAVVGVMVTKSETTKAQTPGGSHVVITGDWPPPPSFIDWLFRVSHKAPYVDEFFLHASVTMDLALQTPTSINPALNLGPSGFNCSNGGTFNVPISATGEVAGWMGGWFDSPPVEFLNDAVAYGKKWLGHTEGLYCDFGTCENFTLNSFWNDTWTSNSAGVSCTTLNANMGECIFAAPKSGSIEVTLQRGVGEMSWGGGDWPASIPPDQIMQSTTTINCLAPAAALEVISATHSPVSPSQGDLVNFNGTIKNTGNQTSTTFTPVLYIDEGSTGVWNRTIPAASASAALAQGAQSDVTWTNAWTAIAPGTHRYKICPDSSGTGCAIRNMDVLIPIIPPTPVVNPPTADLWIVQADATDHSKNITTIARGGSIKLGWSTTNADYCTGSWTTGNLTPPVPLATFGGEVQENNLTTSQTYDLQCFKNSGGSATDQVTVNIANFAIGNFREL